MRIWVVVPVYNGAELLERCLSSILNQRDEEFSVIVADDASTEPGIEATARRHQEAFPESVFYRCQRQNKGATRNIVETIGFYAMQPDDVILVVDGDDRLLHDNVLTRLRRAYRGDVEATYGSYLPEPFDDGCYPARPIPAEVLANGTIRAFTASSGQWFNHPLSFRRRAFDTVPEWEFHWNRDVKEPWLKYGYDVTIFLPLLERVGRRVEWIPDFLYGYTSDRPEAVWREHGEETSAEGVEVMSRGELHIPYET